MVDAQARVRRLRQHRLRRRRRSAPSARRTARRAISASPISADHRRRGRRVHAGRRRQRAHRRQLRARPHLPRLPRRRPALPEAVLRARATAPSGQACVLTDADVDAAHDRRRHRSSCTPARSDDGCDPVAQNGLHAAGARCWLSPPDDVGRVGICLMSLGAGHGRRHLRRAKQAQCAPGFRCDGFDFCRRYCYFDAPDGGITAGAGACPASEGACERFSFSGTDLRHLRQPSKMRRQSSLATARRPRGAHLEELPEPDAGPGEVRVRVAAVALNHLDIWVRNGLPHLKLEYPFRLGADVAGTIDELGAGVRGVAVGDEVVVNPGHSCGRCRECLSGRDNLCRWFGSWARTCSGGYCRADRRAGAERRRRKPKSLAVAEAAALPIDVPDRVADADAQGAGAARATTCWCMAAGSGVGVGAVQIAKLHGARVIATASTDDKLAARARARRRRDHQPRDAGSRRRGQAPDRQARRRHRVRARRRRGLAQADPRRARAAGASSPAARPAGFDARTDLRHVFFRQLEILGSTMAPKGDLFPILDHVGAGRLQAGGRPRHAAGRGPGGPLVYCEIARVFGKIVPDRTITSH